MLEDKIKKYIIPAAIALSGIIYSGCVTEKDPLLVQCCEAIACESEPEWICSEAGSIPYYTQTSCVTDKDGREMCCECHEKLYAGKKGM